MKFFKWMKEITKERITYFFQVGALFVSVTDPALLQRFMRMQLGLFQKRNWNLVKAGR